MDFHFFNPHFEFLMAAPLELVTKLQLFVEDFCRDRIANDYIIATDIVAAADVVKASY
jgi:hypothetical protein